MFDYWMFLIVAISILRYYLEKYGTTLRLSYFPALIAGTDAKPVYLPMERQVTGMLGATCKRPQDRAREIAEVLKDNNYNQDKLVIEDFGMQVRQQPTAIKARVLPPPLVFDLPLIQTRHAPSHNIEKALVDVELQCSTELAQRAPGKSLQLLIVILPDTTGSYGLVKRVLETDLGIVSQCCQPKHVTMANRQYFENLSMKINVKVVASMDWPYTTKYRALMSAQPHRQEIIEDHYSSYACVSLEENYLPRVTFIVMQKRHHTRLFPANHNDRSNTDKNGNILPGMVVDTKICHPTEFDFYLCTHTEIKGTSRPTHYHVLYARCTRSVSKVPAAYYTHLTAFRARYYIEGV
nr:hypothetical protein [Tanacetum cinerariifolium]